MMRVQTVGWGGKKPTEFRSSCLKEELRRKEGGKRVNYGGQVLFRQSHRHVAAGKSKTLDTNSPLHTAQRRKHNL